MFFPIIMEVHGLYKQYFYRMHFSQKLPPIPLYGKINIDTKT